MADEEDDDWFERAFDEDEDAPEEPTEPGASESETDGEDTERGDGSEPSDGDEFGGDASEEGDTFEEDESDGGAFDEREPDEDSFDGDGLDEDDFGEGTADEDELNDGEFDGDGFDEDDFDGGEFDDDAFDGEGNGSGEFGGTEDPFGDDGGDDLFDDDFADAFGGGGGDGGGMGGGFEMGGSGDDFESEDFESDIPRISLGIEGLDDMIQGGVPERSLMVVMGSAGTGKTTFGLQFIGEALENGERAAFVTLEESHERIVNTAEEKGWAFEKHVEEGDLAIVDLDPVEMANSLASIRNELPGLVNEFGASRLVLDSVSLLELMYDDQATRRTEVYQFTKALKEAGVTTMVTSEVSSDDPFTSRYGIIEYLTDAVFILRYIRGEDFRETRLAVEIQKIRDANHSRETKPYEITNTGISVYRQANIF